MPLVIRVEKVSKKYRLGTISRGMLFQDLRSGYARMMGRPDPHAKISETGAGGSKVGGISDYLWALRDVSFEVNEGDVIGIIGRNGSGKSTLLKILSRITAPTEGRVYLKGRVACLLEVGTGFHQELTGRDNIYLNGSILGMTRPEITRKFDEIVDFAGVEKFIDTPVKRYSSGMVVRLAFAVAANLEPEILIIDEVLAVGDAAFQKKCLGKMSAVAREGRTILFVSHHAAAVENLCTRGIVLESGQVKFTGTQTEAIAHYVGCFTQHAGSLRERPDRTARTALQVNSIEFRDLQGRPVTTAQAGQDLDIFFHFENTAPEIPRPTLFVTFYVKSDLDVPIFTQSNLITGQSFDALLPEKGAFVCCVKNLPLPSSIYRLDYVLRSAPLGGVTLDGMDSAVELTVEGGDFFGSGQLPGVHSGVALVAADWRIETGEPSRLSHREPMAAA